MTIVTDSITSKNGKLSKLVIDDHDLSPISYLENRFHKIENTYYDVFQNGDRAKYKSSVRKDRLLMIHSYLATQTTRPNVVSTTQSDKYYHRSAEIISLGIADRIAKFALAGEIGTKYAYIPMLDSLSTKIPLKLFSHLIYVAKEIDNSSLNYSNPKSVIESLSIMHADNQTSKFIGSLGCAELSVELGGNIYGTSEPSGFTLTFKNNTLNNNCYN
jgi:hypothetical protein